MEPVCPPRDVIPPPAPASAPQVMYPRAFVSRTDEPEQPRRLLILIPVAVSMPPWKVEVAVEEELMPPPACKSLATEREFAKVLEAEA